MDEVAFRLVTGSDPELSQERLQRAVEALPKDAVLVDVKFSTAADAERVTYSALLYYKIVESWND